MHAVGYDNDMVHWVDRPKLEQACHVGPVLAVEISIIGPQGPWIGAWKGQKWSKVMLFCALGCDMAHSTLSRWDGLAWRRPTMLVWFLP